MAYGIYTLDLILIGLFFGNGCGGGLVRNDNSGCVRLFIAFN